MPVFPLTLEATYFKTGFFNVKVAHDKYVRQSEGPVELVLLFDGKEERVEASVNRRAQTRTGAARIMGGARLKDWFQKHFEEGAKLDVDLTSMKEIKIKKAST